MNNLVYTKYTLLSIRFNGVWTLDTDPEERKLSLFITLVNPKLNTAVMLTNITNTRFVYTPSSVNSYKQAKGSLLCFRYPVPCVKQWKSYALKSQKSQKIQAALHCI